MPINLLICIVGWAVLLSLTAAGIWLLFLRRFWLGLMVVAIPVTYFAIFPFVSHVVLDKAPSLDRYDRRVFQSEWVMKCYLPLAFVDDVAGRYLNWGVADDHE
ncbi:MAG: hypothetical protein PF961_19815 [Planctomycetota bacterium]|jgi:hypothetical protein|nr:hypothetical protein [Planctomycetota bacterium]